MVTCVYMCTYMYAHIYTHMYMYRYMYTCVVYMCVRTQHHLYSWCVLRSQEVDSSYTRDPPSTPKVNQHCSLPAPGANTLLTNEKSATMAKADVTMWCDDADDWGESRYGVEVWE